MRGDQSVFPLRRRRESGPMQDAEVELGVVENYGLVRLRHKHRPGLRIGRVTGPPFPVVAESQADHPGVAGSDAALWIERFGLGIERDDVRSLDGFNGIGRL